MYLTRAEQRGRQVRELCGQGLSMRAIAKEAGVFGGVTVHNALSTQEIGQGSKTDNIEAY